MILGKLCKPQQANSLTTRHLAHKCAYSTPRPRWSHLAGCQVDNTRVPVAICILPENHTLALCLCLWLMLAPASGLLTTIPVYTRYTTLPALSMSPLMQ